MKKKRKKVVAELPRAVKAALRTALLKDDEEIPLTQEEVAAFDAAHRDNPPPPAHPHRSPSPLFSWERKKEQAAVPELVRFPKPRTADKMALAARSESPISAETQARLANLVKEMKDEGPPHG